jgi:hypothetical protein
MLTPESLRVRCPSLSEIKDRFVSGRAFPSSRATRKRDQPQERRGDAAQEGDAVKVVIKSTEVMLQKD